MKIRARFNSSGIVRGAAVAGLIALCASLLPLSATSAAAEPPKRLNVVELFTSQACSACPPADKLLGELTRREGILPLSLHVDYWNYLDWEDTLAEPAFSSRQRGYAKGRGDRSVFTPQAIINGLYPVVGSDAEALEAALSKAEDDAGLQPIPLRVERDGSDTVIIELGPAPEDWDLEQATLWLVVYVDSHTVEVRGGENAGRTLTYHNVVRRLEPVGSWQGGKLRTKVTVPNAPGKRCAILLQEGGEKRPGAILFAVRP